MTVACIISTFINTHWPVIYHFGYFYQTMILNSFEINVYIVISFALLISALPTQLLSNIRPSTAFTIGTLMPTDTSSVARSARLFT